MAEFMDFAKYLAFKQGTSGTRQDRGENQGGPKPNHTRQAIGHISAQHVKAGVGKVQNPHHAEDQRQARAEHEQQQAIAQTIEHRDKKKLHAQGLNIEENKMASNPTNGKFTVQGIFIWQLVGVLET
jgi:hypothetical protein